METIRIDGASLTPEQVEAVARGRGRAVLDPAARARMAATRAVLESRLAAGEILYGVNTGFGPLKDIRIPPDRLERLQANLIRSHAAGVGPPLPAEETRAVLLLRAHTLAQGASAIRPQIVDTLLAMLGADLLPEIPAQGSVCASGDLAPLAHVALAMVGEGSARLRGEAMPAAAALERAGIPPVRLGPKEGLSLVNGTQVATAIGCLAVRRALNLAAHADLAAAFSIEALRGSAAPFDPGIQALRPHPGQADTAENLRRLLADSPIMASHRDCDRLQDSYSLRCVPQVHGAARDALRHCRQVLAIEINSVTDNPVLAPGGDRFLVGGNFHGAPVGLVLDFLAIAAADLAGISERRLDRLLNPSLSGLPAFLAGEPGLESGLMMAQVTAAALVSENKGLAHPASVDSIPTSGGQEDHVSMGVWAARKGMQVVENAERVIGIEILAASRALHLLRPLEPARALREGLDCLRSRLPLAPEDRVLAEAMEDAHALVRSGDLRRAVEAACGPIRE